MPPRVQRLDAIDLVSVCSPIAGSNTSLLVLRSVRFRRPLRDRPPGGGIGWLFVIIPLVQTASAELCFSTADHVLERLGRGGKCPRLSQPEYPAHRSCPGTMLKVTTRCPPPAEEPGICLLGAPTTTSASVVPAGSPLAKQEEGFIGSLPLISTTPRGSR